MGSKWMDSDPQFLMRRKLGEGPDLEQETRVLCRTSKL